MSKITLLAEKVYLLRSTQTFKDGTVRISYYETPSTWNKSPMEATLFQNYESGEGHLNMFYKRDAPEKGWADGRKEIMEVVPLYGEMLQTSNAIHITVKKE